MTGFLQRRRPRVVVSRGNRDEPKLTCGLKDVSEAAYHEEILQRGLG